MVESRVGRDACQKLFVMMISLLVGPASPEELQVEISGTTVKVTYPLPGTVQWSPDSPDTENNVFTKKNHDSSPLNLTCTADNKNIHMYLKARGE